MTLEDHPVRRAASVSVTLRSLLVDVYSPGSLAVHAHFTGLRHLMFHYPLPASFLGISSIATMVFTLLYFFWHRLFEPAVVVPAAARKDSA